MPFCCPSKSSPTLHLGADHVTLMPGKARNFVQGKFFFVHAFSKSNYLFSSLLRGRCTTGYFFHRKSEPGNLPQKKLPLLYTCIRNTVTRSMRALCIVVYLIHEKSIPQWEALPYNNDESHHLRINGVLPTLTR